MLTTGLNFHNPLADGKGFRVFVGIWLWWLKSKMTKIFSTLPFMEKRDSSLCRREDTNKANIARTKESQR
jgi:hypothetical protein